MDMREICQRHGAYFLDVGKKKSQVRETRKRICREYAGNVPMSWCLFLDVGGKFRWYGTTRWPKHLQML